MFTTYLKAIVGAVIAGLGSALTGLGDNTLSGQEWVTIAIVTLTAFSAVWAAPNKP